jgi:N-acyl-D-amino-acid deacylase
MGLSVGKGVGGRAMTVGYALWTLGLADRKADKTSEAMASYLLRTQRPEGHWTGQVSRPPLEESYQTCTVLAILGLRRYATDAQRARAETAVEKAGKWLATAQAKGQEDKAFRFWGLHLVGGKPEELRAARESILRAQRSDGGWAQLDEMDSDAYATGQTLFILQSTGFDLSEAACQRGGRDLGYPRSVQRSDGKVVTVYYFWEEKTGPERFIAASLWAPSP